MRLSLSAAASTLTIAAATAATGATLTPREASACAMHCHMYMCEQAANELPEGELKSLMTKPEYRDVIFNGSYLPDAGYGAGDAFGEWSHWEPFGEFYIDWIRDNIGGPYSSGKGAERAVFALTSVCHGLGDMTFDTLLLQSQWEIDPQADQSQDLDQDLDIWFIADSDRRYVAPVALPADELVLFFKEYMKHDVTAETIEYGQSRNRQGALGLEILSRSPQVVAEVRGKYKWTSEVYFDPQAPGALPYNAKVISRHYEALWERLTTGTLSQDNFITWFGPPNEREERATNAQSVRSAITVWFGGGLDRSSIPEKPFAILDDEGNPVEYTFDYGSWGGGEWASLLRIRPKNDWRRDVTYTVTVLKGLKTGAGVELLADAPFPFTLRSEIPAETGGDDTTTDGAPETDGADGAAGTGDGTTGTATDETTAGSETDATGGTAGGTTGSGDSAGDTAATDTAGTSGGEGDTTTGGTTGVGDGEGDDTTSEDDSGCRANGSGAPGAPWASLLTLTGVAAVLLRKRRRA
jgi:hypothetical protein